jgi:hypothetical protein
MPLRPGLVVLVAGGLLLFPAAAAADTITLLSPTARTSEPPPLVGKRITGATVGETRFSGRLRNVERIAVGIDRTGGPVGVVVTQRLTISRPGDFTFIVPAPATKVVAAPGSQAEPGLRDLGIVWQGFASGRRVLAATITLAPTAAAVLPLRVSVERRAGAIVVRLEDVARGRLTVTTGSVAPAAVTTFLGRLRREGTAVVPSQLALPGRATGQAVIGVTAPLRVRGTIAVPGQAPVAVSVVLGAGRPTARIFTVAGRALPRLDLRVEPLGPLEILPGPRDPVLSLAGLQRVLGSVALARQYHHFLDSPDPSGPSSAVYAYRTVERLPALPAGGRSSGGDDTLTIVLVAVLGAAALLGGAILWAHL